MSGSVAAGPQNQHPDFAVACRLEALAKRIEKAGRDSSRVAMIGLELIRTGLSHGVLDQLNLMSDIANGECAGVLSERVLDNLFEDDHVRDRIVPMILHAMASSEFSELAIGYFGGRTVQHWKGEFTGLLFSDQNVAKERDIAQVLGARDARMRMVSGIAAGPQATLDF